MVEVETVLNSILIVFQVVCFCSVDIVEQEFIIGQAILIIYATLPAFEKYTHVSLLYVMCAVREIYRERGGRRERRVEQGNIMRSIHFNVASLIVTLLSIDFSCVVSAN